MEHELTIREKMLIKIREVTVLRNGLQDGPSYYPIIDSMIDEIASMVCLDIDVDTPNDIPESLWFVIQKIVVATFSTIGKESLQSVSGIVSETYKDIYGENRGPILKYVENQERRKKEAALSIRYGIPADWGI